MIRRRTVVAAARGPSRVARFAPVAPFRSLPGSRVHREGDSDLGGIGRQARRVVAGLIAQSSGHLARAERRRSGHAKTHRDGKAALEDRQRLRREGEFFPFRFRVQGLEGFERPRLPGQAQRNQVRLCGGVAVDVITLTNFHRDRGSGELAPPGADRRRRTDFEYGIILRGTEQRPQQEQQADGPIGCPAPEVLRSRVRKHSCSPIPRGQKRFSPGGQSGNWSAAN